MSEKKKNKRTILDKIIFAVFGIISTALFVNDIFKDYITDEHWEIKISLALIGCLSWFFEILSFLWDKKFINLKNEILGVSTGNDNVSVAVVKQELINTKKALLDDFGGVRKYVAGAFETRQIFSDSFLAEKENDLKSFLHLDNEDNDYAIIYVITNAFDVELEGFGNVIRDNILKDYQYVYITPFPHDEFREQLRSKIVGNVSDDHLLKAAFTKNIHHISKPEFFKYKPAYSDIVIYSKKQYMVSGANKEKNIGFYCYQNGPIIENVQGFSGTKSIEQYYYYQMSEKNVDEFLNTFFSDNSLVWNSVISSWLSEKVEYRSHSTFTGAGGGLFVKQGCTLNDGDTVFIMGGYFMNSVDINRHGGFVSDNTYLQICDSMYLCGITTEMEKVMFKANHSCSPNCKLNDEITFITIGKLNSDDEILIDYGTLGEHYCTPFKCRNSKCKHYDKCNHDISTSSMRLDTNPVS
jgi:hypothetical protein